MVGALRPADRRDAVRLGAAFVALSAFDVSGVDLPISRLFGTAAGFAWREHWFVGGILHADARWLAWIVAVALIVNVWRRAVRARPVALRARLWVGTTLAWSC